VIFAAGHAPYANQPSYARVVELIIPAMAFGSLYLAFGLLPGIVLHFTYDTAWMSLPLFVSSTGRAHIEQAIVILLVLTPLWVVIVNRVRMGRWTEVPADAFNGSWKPREVGEVHHEPIAFPEQTVISPAALRALPAIGLVGLLVWIFASPFHTDAPPVRITRGEAEQKARQALTDRGITLDPSWTTLSHVEGQPGEQNRFVWQTAGESIYKKLIGVYVTPPHWFVRFARFQGDVEARAEEYQVLIDGSGHVFRIAHDLPEAKPGKNLTQDEARAIAVRAVGEAQARGRAASDDETQVQEVSAEASKKPARTDWTFIFKDTANYGLPQGEPRISVEIGGDEITDLARYVYIPEEWSRNERRDRNLPGILSTICNVALIAIVVAVTIIGIVQWSRRRDFSSRAFATIFALLFLISAVDALNNWPAQKSQASTAQPLLLTAAEVLSTSLLLGVAIAAGLGIAGGFLGAKRTFLRPNLIRNYLTTGISLGLAVIGIAALARHAVPSTKPLWGNMAGASSYVPLVTMALSPITGFFVQAILLLTVIRVAGRRPRRALLLIVVGLAAAGSGSIETIPSWLAIGLVTGIILMLAYLLVFRHQPMLVIPAAATAVAFSVLRDGIQRPYPTAVAGSIAAAVLIAVVAWVWYRRSVTVME
jgi:hypothetical protein